VLHAGVNGEEAKRAEEQAMIRDANHWLSSGRYDEKPHHKTGAYALHIAAAKGYIQVIK
jgi:protein phosphatase 1 regulatory subunit 12C